MTKATKGGDIISDISARAAARILEVTPQAVGQMASRGVFVGAVRDDYSGHWRIPSDEVERVRSERRERSGHDHT